MIPWVKFSSGFRGQLVKGDKNAPPTKWWNYHWLLWFGWKCVAVFRVSDEVAEKGYHVGFKPQTGEAEIHLALCHSRTFKMAIGHEDCVFFAIDEKGHEVPLKLLAIAKKNEDQYSGAEQF
ncbi:MAG: hypothetical protein PHC53_03845 [Patescibacteria group bacterium]|nr:hypothetical protein [Patescibacteria group bacterium]